MTNYSVTKEEKAYLRELARLQLEYAHLPIMEERKRLWYLHNSLKGERPMIVMEEDTFLKELMPPLRYETYFARIMEAQLLCNIIVHERISDDKVIPDHFNIFVKIDSEQFGLSLKRNVPKSGIGYHVDRVINDLEENITKLKPSTYYYNHEYTNKLKDCVEETIGDILPIQMKNSVNYWAFGITQKIVDIMGMENMLLSMMDTPDLFHQLMKFITDDLIRFLRWQEENDLLFVNNGNDYMGSGSFCFTHELPRSDSSDAVKSTDLWGHINSQESVGISPGMYKEFMYPYYAKIAEQFGLVYYGCCEPVHDIWDNCLQYLPNLRKISISDWCNEEIMAERLSDSTVIYSRKPSPNYIGVGKELDEEAFRQYIQKTIDLTRNCKVEFIFRDIYSLNGNIEKVKRAVDIVRELTS